MSNIIKYETDNGEIQLSPEIVKRYLVSGDASRVTDQEVVMFMQMCKYQNLNPFLREAYLIKFGNSPATMVTGKDTFVKRAAKSKLCKGYEAGVIVENKNGEIEYRKGSLALKGETLVGGWGKVYRIDWELPLEISVAIDEYIRTNNQGQVMSNWKKMPGTMIRKVALVQALREAIPEEFGGLYSPEEMPVDDSVLEESPISVEVLEEEPKKTISEAQQREIFALAKGNQEIVRQVLKEYHLSGTNEVTKDVYEEICTRIELLAKAEETEESKEEVIEEVPFSEIGEDILPWNEED